MTKELQQYIERRKKELLNPDGTYKVKASIIPGRFSACISVIDKSHSTENVEVRA